MKWLKYQEDWINDKSRLKILVKSRRIGGTFSTSYAVWKRLMETRNHDITVVTRDEKLAVEFVANVKKWIQIWNLVCKDKNEVVPKSCMNRLSLEIPHGDGPSRLLAVSSNPDAVIGKGGDIILDEFAVHRDPELLFSLAQPVIMAGGNCTILSTHRSRNTLFNKLVEEAKLPDSEWSLHRTTLEDAVDQGLLDIIVNPTLKKLGNDPFDTSEDFIAWIKKTTDEHTYDQEYDCNPSDSATVLLSRQEIKDSFKKLVEEGSLKIGQTYMGWDIAESEFGDFATLCVLRVNSESEVEVIYSEYIKKGTSIDDQIAKIKKLDREYTPYRIVCDENGIGRYPTSVLKKKLGNRVIGFVSSMNSKAEMFTKVKRFFENGKVRMLEDDAIETDFLSIERTITPSNNIVYSASRINGSHGDMASAFSMALTEVPENFNVTVQGVKTIPTKRVEPSPTQETIHDRIARNRKLDKIAKKRFTM